MFFSLHCSLWHDRPCDSTSAIRMLWKNFRSISLAVSGSVFLAQFTQIDVITGWPGSSPLSTFHFPLFAPLIPSFRPVHRAAVPPSPLFPASRHSKRRERAYVALNSANEVNEWVHVAGRMARHFGVNAGYEGYAGGAACIGETDQDSVLTYSTKKGGNRAGWQFKTPGSRSIGTARDAEILVI